MNFTCATENEKLVTFGYHLHDDSEEPLSHLDNSAVQGQPVLPKKTINLTECDKYPCHTALWVTVEMPQPTQNKSKFHTMSCTPEGHRFIRLYLVHLHHWKIVEVVHSTRSWPFQWQHASLGSAPFSGLHLWHPEQTAHHVLFECPDLRPPEGAQVDLINPNPETVAWLRQLQDVV